MYPGLNTRVIQQIIEYSIAPKPIEREANLIPLLFQGKSSQWEILRARSSVQIVALIS